MTSAMLVDT